MESLSLIFVQKYILVTPFTVNGNYQYTEYMFGHHTLSCLYITFCTLYIREMFLTKNTLNNLMYKTVYCRVNSTVSN